MLILIPLLPFIGFVVNAFLGKRLPKSISGGLACAAIVGSFAVALAAVWSVVSSHHAMEQTAFTWITSGELSIPFAFRLDNLSSLMILVITGIGSLIHIYSTGYMHDEPDSEYARYFSYLNLFAAFMLVLVLGASFPVMFVGWEGVGLCSYLLIGFWFKKKSASDAGKKAFVVNRVGDFGFILAMLIIFVTFGTLDIQAVAAAAHSTYTPETAGIGVITAATLLLFLGATGKSAQIPLYVWLPDAMEGPTPVSALIHAATMVTAGVYLIGRCAVLFSLAPITLAVVAAIGTATALMAGTIGLVQNDIKRVLAYSTVSQLGYMFLAMGVGAYAAGIFHLYTHAFFKALLFLGSGAVIHALAGEQDLRNMGGLKKHLPITYWTFLIGALAIAGIPPLAGFFSKDEILWRTYSTEWPAFHLLLYGVGILTAFLTATYMFRLVFMAFHGERRHEAPPAHPEEEEPVAHAAAAHAASAHVAPSTKHGTQHAAPSTQHAHGAHIHDAPPAMAFALIVLAMGSVLAGFIGVPHAIGGNNWIETFLEPAFLAPGAVHEAAEAVHAGASVELMLMGLSVGLAAAGIGLASYFWLRNPAASAAWAQRFSGIHRLLLNKYYVDELYDAAIVQPIKGISTGGLWKGVDAGGIDFAVNGVGLGVRGSSSLLRRLQTGSIRVYAASLFAGAVVVLGYYLWR
ncbi:MAG TPA: NADH-quinone oxidoreductase subunit L [Vicinamibacterales bacterium]|jgi:NADH-quinone oxidoreductase subunit L|nr:NADH-quinone oxidoreductase subunit L [Vicinamibacterales bacterium]